MIITKREIRNNRSNGKLKIDIPFFPLPFLVTRISFENLSSWKNQDQQGGNVEEDIGSGRLGRGSFVDARFIKI